jgi:hypothetical protein
MLRPLCHRERAWQRPHVGVMGWIQWQIQGGSNMTGTNCDSFTHKSSRSYFNHLVQSLCNRRRPVAFSRAFVSGVFASSLTRWTAVTWDLRSSEMLRSVQIHAAWHLRRARISFYREAEAWSRTRGNLRKLLHVTRGKRVLMRKELVVLKQNTVVVLQRFWNH